MTSPKLQQGFTAVELLITLIVASMFLFAGYQLYTQVTRDGTDANRTAILSNLVNEKLREEATTTTNAAPSGCTAGSNKDVTSAPANLGGLTGVQFRTQVSCPTNGPGTLDLFLIKITGSYTERGQTVEVQHATYVN